jgi:hypothetical protein
MLRANGAILISLEFFPFMLRSVEAFRTVFQQPARGCSRRAPRLHICNAKPKPCLSCIAGDAVIQFVDENFDRAIA